MLSDLHGVFHLEDTAIVFKIIKLIIWAWMVIIAITWRRWTRWRWLHIIIFDIIGRSKVLNIFPNFFQVARLLKQKFSPSCSRSEKDSWQLYKWSLILNKKCVRRHVSGRDRVLWAIGADLPKHSVKSIRQKAEITRLQTTVANYQISLFTKQQTKSFTKLISNWGQVNAARRNKWKGAVKGSCSVFTASQKPPHLVAKIQPTPFHPGQVTAKETSFKKDSFQKSWESKKQLFRQSQTVRHLQITQTWNLKTPRFSDEWAFKPT